MMLGALAALPMWGCIRDGASDTDDAALAPGMVRVDYTIDGMTSATRATAVESHESRLDDVHILFYTEEGAYVTCQHAAVTAGTSSFSFPVPAELKSETPYRTLIVGNAHSHTPTGYASFDTYVSQSSSLTYDEMYQAIYAERNMDHSTSGQHTGSLPMWGELIDGTGQPVNFQFTKAGNGAISFTGTAHFSRSVCRLDLQHLVAQKLIIDAVKLCNYRKAGYYFHNDVPKGEIQSGLEDQSWISVGAPYAGNPTTAPDVKDHQELMASVYAFPNIVPVVRQNDEETTYLMIRGYYQDGTDNTPDHPKAKLTYYRFNMAENGKSQVLRRNYRYLAIINSVAGPGSEDEQGAEDAEAPLLGYTVDDTWTDDENTSTSDSKGNFLTLSRAMVTFDGYKDLSEVVKVSVREGLTWSLEWDKTLVGEESAQFNYGRIDDRQFSISTLADNATDFTRNARLIVKATGGTVDPDKPLTATVSVMQFTSKEETSTLMVDGQTGTITRTVPGVGATLTFQVETGSLRSGWMVSDANNTASASGVTWTQKGANRGALEINVPTNISTSERAFSFKVQRLGTTGAVDDTVAPVTINLTQSKSDYLLTVSPSVPMDQQGLVIDAFDPTPGVNPNGISKQQQFTVTLADPEHYTWTATSSFHKDYDAFLTMNDAADKTTQAQWTDNSGVKNTITEGTSGQSVWLNVFRTAPGDPTFTGTLTFTAVPKDSDGSYATQSVNVTVTIKTMCSINDVLIPVSGTSNSLLVADRNVGASLTRIDQDGRFVTAGDFSTVSGMEITGKGVPENSFEQWRGGSYDWKTVTGGSMNKTSESFLRTEFFREGQIQTNYDNEGVYSPWYKEAEVTQWHVPTTSELTNSLLPQVIYSKQRPFLVSAYKDLSGNYVGCFVPLTGSGVDYATSYWTSTNSGSAGYVCSFSTSAARQASTPQGNMCGARCVRSIALLQVQQAQTDGYIGVKWQ